MNDTTTDGASARLEARSAVARRQLCAGSLRHDLALRHEGHAVGIQGGLIEVVQGHQYGQVVNPRLSFTPTGSWNTWREVSVTVDLIAGTNRELGQRLFISEATVKTHLAHIYAKLGVETRAAAIATAIRREGMR